MNQQKLQERIAARSEEREQVENRLIASIISMAAFGNSQLTHDVLAICKPEQFISPQAKCIYQAIERLCHRNESFDLTSVGAELSAMADRGSSMVKVHELGGIVAEWAYYSSEGTALRAAERIAIEWGKDQAALEIGEAGRSVSLFSEMPEKAQEHLKRANEYLEYGMNVDDFSLRAAFGRYSEHIDSEVVSPPIKSPWANVNAILRGGIVPGELSILAARPSVGKSALALNWSLSVARSGKKVMFFSLEMAESQLVERIIANVGGINLGSFRQGMSKFDRERVKKTIADMNKTKMDIIDTSRVSVSKIRKIARNAKHKPDFIVVDYLQLVSPEDTRIPREQQVAGMSRGLKILAKEIHVPVLLLAQLSRKGEDANREPILSDLRESGAIEQDADIVMFLHQARKRTWHHDEPVKFIIAKGRSSGVGTGHLVFKRNIQRFEESSEEEYTLAESTEMATGGSHWQELD